MINENVCVNGSKNQRRKPRRYNFNQTRERGQPTDHNKTINIERANPDENTVRLKANSDRGANSRMRKSRTRRQRRHQKPNKEVEKKYDETIEKFLVVKRHPLHAELPELIHKEEVKKAGFKPPFNNRDIVFDLMVCRRENFRKMKANVRRYITKLNENDKQEIEISSKSLIGFTLSRDDCAVRGAHVIMFFQKELPEVFEFRRIEEWLEYLLPCRCCYAVESVLSEDQKRCLGIFLLELYKLLDGTQSENIICSFLTDLARDYIMKSKEPNDHSWAKALQAMMPFLDAQTAGIQMKIMNAIGKGSGRNGKRYRNVVNRQKRKQQHDLQADTHTVAVVEG